MSTSSVVWYKDPADDAWYQFDWSGTASDGTQFLPSGVAIERYEVTLTDPYVTKLADNANGPLVMFQASGGYLGQIPACVACEIWTTDGSAYKTTKLMHVLTRTS